MKVVALYAPGLSCSDWAGVRDAHLLLRRLQYVCLPLVVLGKLVHTEVWAVREKKV